MYSERYRQNMLAQIDIKKRANAFEERKEMYKKKYLSEIVENEKPEFGSNNLILAPVGSGKSHLIENLLIPDDYDKKVIYLTSNSALKDSICPNDNHIRKVLADKGESVRFFTTENKSKFGDAKYSVHVMTYAEFGGRIHPPHQTFTDDVGLIFCDEIHSLPRYFSYDGDYKLFMALNWILRKHEDIDIYYFTATKDSIDEFKSKNKGYFDGVKTFDYLNHPNIRKYIAKTTYYVSHINQLRPHFKARLESFSYDGSKILAFTRLIENQEKLKRIAEEEGFKPIALWSVNNKDNEMTDEQLRVREYILNTGYIPEPYNVLIINGAMQEGWNLYDDKVSLAILDTVDVTEQIQALGRIRRDIDFVIKKTSDKSLMTASMIIDEGYLNRSLTKSDKQSLSKSLNILDSQGRVRGWTTVKKLIESAGYNIVDTYENIDNKRTRVSIITLKS